ncbi:OB-fold protein (plasmid) [Acinetobacter baumannii]
MKKLFFLVVLLSIVGCNQEPKTPNTDTKGSQTEASKKDLLTENEKAFIKFSIEDEISILPTLSSGDNESILLTNYFPVYSAEQLTNDYAKNEIKANNLYKNRYFFINGKISGIEAGLDDKPVVQLATQANYGFNSPMLRFNKVDFGNVAELNKGQKATFFCVGKSEIAGSPVLDDCLFLQTFSNDILNKALEFKDQSISGENKQLEKAIYKYVRSALLLGQLTDDFKKCKVNDVECIGKLSKNLAEEDAIAYKEIVRSKLPKATESMENK